MRIALDAMGSDNYPAPELAGALQAVRTLGCEVVLIGDEAQLRPSLDALQPGVAASKITIVHAPEQIKMAEKPALSARHKPENSMAMALQLLKDGQADAFVTMGNTGAAMTNALLLGRLPGVKRPALLGTFPTATGKALVLDIGANAECKPFYLLQFGVMGSIYAEKVLGFPNPRVALLSNGEEAGKGNDLVKAAYPLLAGSGLNFIGNVEGKELFAGMVDVLVTDGFTGNIALKVAEATAQYFGRLVKDAFMRNWLTQLAGVVMRQPLRQAAKPLDPNEIGAAPLLGVRGLVFIGHGRSNAHAVSSAIQTAVTACEKNVLMGIAAAIGQAAMVVEKE
jgi:glycerol-3-phosphate acyltransferase PlsX